jgi:uncharacterized protein DUF5947
MTPGAMASSRLRAVARGAAQERAAALEHCDMCGEPLPEEHRHVLNLENRELMCACRACTLLFDGRPAGGEHFRLVPERRLVIEDITLDDALWASLRIPVEMAFFFENTREGRVMAYYPSPMGPVESQLELAAWDDLAEGNPVLQTMEPDVETLLVNRARGARQHMLVPIEDAYRLVGTIRARWRGLTGGSEAWAEIERFFTALAGRCRTVTADGQETT